MGDENTQGKSLIPIVIELTNEQEINLHNFEARVRQLMMAYAEEKQKNAALQEQLDACQQQLADAQSSVDRLKQEYSTLKMARMIEVSGDDVKNSRMRLAHLIREVDKCIALLDV